MKWEGYFLLGLVLLYGCMVFWVLGESKPNQISQDDPVLISTSPACISFQSGHTEMFYSSRSRLMFGDKNTEFEVFRGQDGMWVAVVWDHGKCFHGKLKERTL